MFQRKPLWVFTYNDQLCISNVCGPYRVENQIPVRALIR
jgi:hypothetical protein